MDKQDTKWITEIDQRSKSNTKRLDEVTKDVDDLKKNLFHYGEDGLTSWKH